MRTVFVTLALAAVAVAADDPPADTRPAADVLEQAQAKAKTDEKAVFLSFGAPDIVWVKHLDKFNARPKVAKLLGKHLVFAKVDVATNPGAADLYKKFAPDDAGLPMWVILSADGKVLADCMHPKEGNVGFPAEPHEIEHYKAALKKALPKLPADDLDTVMAELKEAQPKDKDG